MHVVRENHNVAFSELLLSECVLINSWNKNEIRPNIIFRKDN